MSNVPNLINIATKSSGPKYWRSLNQLAGTKEFGEWVHREFPANASEMLDGNSRRTVLKMMAASFGLAGLTACHRPVEHILPYAKGVEDMIPGHPYFYSTVMSMAGGVTGLLVESHDGRPTKIEGNPDHPGSMGAATAMQQAAILGLYDPDRSSKVLQGGKDSDWASFETAARALQLGDGTGLRFLSESVTSPSLMALRADALKKFPKAKWVEYEPISRENERVGLEMAFGQTVEPLRQFDKAKVVVALDADFLGLDSPTVVPTKQYSKGRKFASEEDFEKANRLYAVESQFSLTGANADHRLRMRSGEVKQFALTLASLLGAVPGLGVVQGGGDKAAKFMAAVVKDLKAAGAESLVVAGSRQPAIVHALAAAINQTLGSAAISYIKAEKVESGVEALRALTTEMASGQVQTLVMLGGNPAYTAPADLRFAVSLSNVANSIHLGLDDDETAAAAKWHIPEAHFLESWSDARTVDGVSAVQQPLISPLFDGKTAAEIVALLIDSKDRKAYDIVKNYWQGQWSAKDKEAAWKKALNDGVIAGTKPVEPAKVSADAKKIAGAITPTRAPEGLEVGFYPSASAWDGRFANNGWMQEAPDPITKLTWGNAAMISPATARDMKLEDGDMVSVASGTNYKLEAAVMIQPGHADNCVSISLGYGRARCGHVGKDVGYNANLIRTSDAYWFGDKFVIDKLGKKIAHATTQEHGTPDDKGVNAEHLYDGQSTRQVFRETSLEEYKKQPKVVEEMMEIPELHSIYPEVTYKTGNQWGMAIDLTSCTGCNACVVACQAENNIPVVGRDQVMRGREMHWIRMDRYYTGPEDDPQLVEQPLPCLQCENAPCENVCPVAATTHSPEGLNDMAYNRCVGTRYCANNCPVKVRHFNFLNFHKHDSPEFAMAQNPDVTVRMRGVMEKCTYCVQRIQETKIKAKIEGRRPIKDGEIVTACQQTCPADAIVFGNINDPESRVSKLKKQERNYAMLAELDIKPRTTYLAKLRNPNPELTKNG